MSGVKGERLVGPLLAHTLFGTCQFVGHSFLLEHGRSVGHTCLLEHGRSVGHTYTAVQLPLFSWSERGETILTLPLASRRVMNRVNTAGQREKRGAVL